MNTKLTNLKTKPRKPRKPAPKPKKNYSESDMGPMQNYDPNLGMKPKKTK